MREAAAPSGLEGTYKGRSIEGFLDLHFYRPVGYSLALAARRLSLTPATLTLTGGVLGVTAGVFYRHAELPINLAGMFLHVLSNAFDNADGQLARLTKTGSREGRALDGLIDNLIFASIYVHLCVRYTSAGGSALIWLLMLAAAGSHSVQSAAADHLRNAYLYFTGQRSELDSSKVLRPLEVDLSWQKTPWKKLLFSLYLNYTREQEFLFPRVVKLREMSEAALGRIALAYATAGKPVIKLAGALTTNARMLVLFIFLLLSRPEWYLWTEVTALNLCLLIVISKQNSLTKKLESNNVAAVC